MLFLPCLPLGPDRLRHPADLQHLRRPHQVLQPSLRHRHLAVVHEREDAAEVVAGHVAEDDDGVLAGVALKKKSERSDLEKAVKGVAV